MVAFISTATVCNLSLQIRRIITMLHITQQIASYINLISAFYDIMYSRYETPIRRKKGQPLWKG